MYISKSFIPILKNNPSEAKIKSHQLMLRIGMIKQSSAGIYSWLPLGFKVMKKIEVIKVVIINFFSILGFLGAPASLPFSLALNSLLLELMPMGKTEKKIIHQIDI